MHPTPHPPARAAAAAAAPAGARRRGAAAAPTGETGSRQSAARSVRGVAGGWAGGQGGKAIDGRGSAPDRRVGRQAHVKGQAHAVRPRSARRQPSLSPAPPCPPSPHIHTHTPGSASRTFRKTCCGGRCSPRQCTAGSGCTAYIREAVRAAGGDGEGRGVTRWAAWAAPVTT